MWLSAIERALRASVRVSAAPSTDSPPNPLNLDGLPPAPARRGNAALVQRLRNPRCTRNAVRPDRINHRPQIGVRDPAFACRFSAALVRSEIARRSSSATIAMMPTVSLLAFGMSAAVNAIPERCNPKQKMRIAGEAIELRDDQRCPAHPAFRQRPRELWTIVALVALDLDEFRQRRSLEAGEIAGRRVTLRLDAQPRAALPVGRNPQIVTKLPPIILPTASITNGSRTV
jgi:hypothetical protein